jgi:hypothetical protein
VHEVSRRVWGLRLRRTERGLALSSPFMLPSAHYKDVGVRVASFRSSIAHPTYSPVYASSCTSRYPTQNSGPSGSLLLTRENFAFSASSRLFRKHLPADCVGRGLGTQPDLHRETETPKASQVMVSTTFPPPLFGCVFGAKKWHTSFQHAVKNDQHMMSHRDNRAFLATPWC